MICNGSDALFQIFQTLPWVELQVTEVTLELVRVCLLDPVSAHLHCSDRLPGMYGGLFLGETCLHVL
jgi:hypothetical protein